MGERSREENIGYFTKLKAYCGRVLESLAPVPEHIAAYSAYIGDREKALSTRFFRS